MFFYPTAAGQQPMMFAAPMTNTTPGTDAPQPTMMPFTTSVPTNTNSTNQNNTNTNEKGSNTNTSNPNSSTSSLFPPQATGAGAIPMAMPVPMTAVPFSLNLSPGTMTNGVTTDSIPPATSNVSVSGAASFQTGHQPVVTSPDGSGLLPMSSMATATTAAPGVSVPNLKTSNTNTNTNDNNNNLSTVLNSAASPPSYEAVVLDPNGPRSQTNLFVRKLASAVTEKDVQSLFEPFGKILSFGLMRNIHTGEPLGTAFVRFAEHEQAKAAMEALEGKELYGRSISIQWAKKHHDGTPVGEARQKIHKVFVRNVPLDISGKELRAVFAPHGAISNVTLHDDTAPMTTADGQSVPSQRNIAFIVFHDDGAAESAVKVLHNTCPFPSCNGIPLMVKLAEDNRQRLERKHKLGESLGTVHTNSSMLLPPNISDTALVEMSHRLRTPEVGTLTSAQGSAASPTLQMTNNSTTSPGTSIPFLNPQQQQQQQQQQMMMQGLPPGAIAVPGGFMFPVTMQPQQMNAANNNNNNSNNNNNNSTQQQQQPFFYPYMPQPVPSGNNSGGTSGGMPMYAYPQFFFPNQQQQQQQQQQPQFFVTMDASGNQVGTPTPMFFAPMPPQMNASGNNNNNNNNMQMQPQPMMMMPFPMMQPQQQMGYNTNMSANTTNHTSSGLRSVNNSPQTTSLSGTPAQNTFSVVASNSPGNVNLSKGGAAAKTPVVPNPAAPSATLVGSGAGMMGMPVLMSAANNHGTTNAFSSGALNNNDNNSTQNVTANAGKSVSSLMPPRMSSMPDFTSLQQKSLLGGTQGSATKGKSTQQHPQQRTYDGYRPGNDEEEEVDALFSNIGTNLEVSDEDGIVGNDSTKAGKGCGDKKGSNTAAAANQNASTADDDEDMVAYTQDLMEHFRLRTSTNSSDGINPTTN